MAKHSGQEIFLTITKLETINKMIYLYFIAGIECCGMRTEKLPTNKYILITQLFLGPEMHGIVIKGVISKYCSTVDVEIYILLN